MSLDLNPQAYKNTGWAFLVTCELDDDIEKKDVSVLFYGVGYHITRVRDKDCVKNRVKRAKIVRFTLC